MTTDGIEIGFRLDRQWHWMRGDMERSKRPTLLLLAQTLDEARVPYAIIGGIAMQAHAREPRTTIDIDIGVESRDAIPRALLQGRGFTPTGTITHSENWVGPDGTPVQFTDDDALRPAIERAATLDLDGQPLRVLQRQDLLREKLRAASDPARRRSKRLQDLADAEALLEVDPALRDGLTDEERRQLGRLPG